MNKNQLRQWFSNQCDITPTDEEWAVLDEEGLVDAVLRKENRAQWNLLSELTNMRRPRQSPQGWTTKARNHYEQVHYEPADKKRVLALSEYYARLAAEWPDVRNFRESVLGESSVTTEHIRFYARVHCMEEEADGEVPHERLLTNDEAQAFLTSPAMAVLSLEQFREWNIPIVGHKVTPGIPWTLYEQVLWESTRVKLRP